MSSLKPYNANCHNPITKEWKDVTITVSNFNSAVDVRTLSIESGGGSASFDTEVLPQEQVVQEDVYPLADEAYHWCVQGVPPSDQCSFSISTTETVGEVVPNDCKVDGASDDQETYRVVEETPRSSATETKVEAINKSLEFISLQVTNRHESDFEAVTRLMKLIGYTEGPISLESERLLNEQKGTGNKWLDT